MSTGGRTTGPEDRLGGRPNIWSLDGRLRSEVVLLAMGSGERWSQAASPGMGSGEGPAWRRRGFGGGIFGRVCGSEVCGPTPTMEGCSTSFLSQSAYPCDGERCDGNATWRHRHPRPFSHGRRCTNRETADREMCRRTRWNPIWSTASYAGQSEQQTYRSRRAGFCDRSGRVRLVRIIPYLRPAVRRPIRQSFDRPLGRPVRSPGGGETCGPADTGVRVGRLPGERVCSLQAHVSIRLVPRSSSTNAVRLPLVGETDSMRSGFCFAAVLTPRECWSSLVGDLYSSWTSGEARPSHCDLALTEVHPPSGSRRSGFWAGVPRETHSWRGNPQRGRRSGGRRAGAAAPRRRGPRRRGPRRPRRRGPRPPESGARPERALRRRRRTAPAPPPPPRRARLLRRPSRRCRPPTTAGRRSAARRSGGSGASGNGRAHRARPDSNEEHVPRGWTSLLRLVCARLLCVCANCHRPCVLCVEFSFLFVAGAGATPCPGDVLCVVQVGGSRASRRHCSFRSGSNRTRHTWPPHPSGISLVVFLGHT